MAVLRNIQTSLQTQAAGQESLTARLEALERGQSQAAERKKDRRQPYSPDSESERREEGNDSVSERRPDQERDDLTTVVA